MSWTKMCVCASSVPSCLVNGGLIINHLNSARFPSSRWHCQVFQLLLKSQASNHAVIYWLKGQLFQACGCNLSSCPCASMACVICFLNPMVLISQAGLFSFSWNLVMAWAHKAQGRSGACTSCHIKTDLIFLWVFCHWWGSVMVSFVTGRTRWLLGQQVQCSCSKGCPGQIKVWEIGCVFVDFYSVNKHRV